MHRRMLEASASALLSRAARSVEMMHSFSTFWAPADQSLSEWRPMLLDNGGSARLFDHQTMAVLSAPFLQLEINDSL